MTILSISIPRRQRLGACCLLTLGLLSACSGGSGSSQDSQAISGVTRSGVFGAIPTAGIRYRSPSHSGTTNAAGEFRYVAGEDVDFLLGDMLLGTVAGAARIDEFDIAEVAQPPQNQTQWSDYFDLRSHRGPLSKAANLAGILQTLDTNQDLSDGIDILPEVAALFAPNQIDLYQPYWRLSDDRRMRKLLFRAADQTALTPRALRTGSLALQHLLDFTISLHQRFEQDRGNDGTLDYAATYVYNSQGKVVSTEVDDDGDGTVDKSWHSSFNTNNVQISSRLDPDNSGNLSSGWETELNDFGVLTKRDTFDEDGLINGGRDQTWDTEGALTYREKRNGTDRSIERWFFEEGLLVSYEKDADGNGSIDETQRYFDVDLNTDYTERHWDSDADGVVDAIYTYSLNAVGQPLRTTEDSNADGSIDITTEFDYNSFGEAIESRIYDGSGNLTRRQTWEFTSDGTRVSATRDNNGDGVINWRATYVEATATSPREVHFDTDGDGVDDYSNFYTLDSNGLLLHWATDSNGDGVMDSSHQNSFEGSRLVRSESDNDGDGVVDQVTTYSDWVTLPITAFL